MIQHLLRDEAVAHQGLIPFHVSLGLRQLRLDCVDVRALGFDFDRLSGLELSDPDFGFSNERAAVRGLGTQSCPRIFELAGCVIALSQPLLVRREVNEGIAGVDCLALNDPDRFDAVIRCRPDSNDFAFGLEPSARGHNPTRDRPGAGGTGTCGFLMRIDARRGAAGDERVHRRENHNTRTATTTARDRQVLIIRLASDYTDRSSTQTNSGGVRNARESNAGPSSWDSGGKAV